MIPTITLDNFTEHLWNYTMSLYGDEIEANRANCPYDLDDLSEEHSMKQLTTWFMFIRTNPRTGMTIVEEFSRRFVKDPELAKMLLRARKAFYGTFTVLAKIKDSVDPAGKDQNNGEYGIILVGAPEDDTYRIIVTDKTYALYAVGTQFMGIIHPWLGNGTHKTCGILNARFPPDDDLELKESKNVMSMLNPETIENLIKYSKKSKARMKKRDESHIIERSRRYLLYFNDLTLNVVDGIQRS